MKYLILTSLLFSFTSFSQVNFDCGPRNENGCDEQDLRDSRRAREEARPRTIEDALRGTVRQHGDVESAARSAGTAHDCPPDKCRSYYGNRVEDFNLCEGHDSVCVRPGRLDGLQNKCTSPEVRRICPERYAECPQAREEARREQQRNSVDTRQAARPARPAQPPTVAPQARPNGELPRCPPGLTPKECAELTFY